MTKNEMFIKAHKMAKEIKAEYPEVNYKFQFALCLAYLQEGENEMVELQGTEKQIAWAEKIRAEKIQEANAAKEKNEALVAKQGKLNKATEMFLNNIARFIERAEIETSAKWYIDNRDNKAIMFNNWK